MREDITIRVTHKTEDKHEKPNIRVSNKTMKMLDRPSNSFEHKDLNEKLDHVKRFGRKIDPVLLAKLIREDRETR